MGTQTVVIVTHLNTHDGILTYPIVAIIDITLVGFLLVLEIRVGTSNKLGLLNCGGLEPNMMQELHDMLRLRQVVLI